MCTSDESNRMAREILALRAEGESNVLPFVRDRRCATCANWKELRGGDETAMVCFLTGDETNSDFECRAWAKIPRLMSAQRAKKE